MSEMINVFFECFFILFKNMGVVYIFRLVKMLVYDGNDDLNVILFWDWVKKKNFWLILNLYFNSIVWGFFLCSVLVV